MLKRLLIGLMVVVFTIASFIVVNIYETTAGDYLRDAEMQTPYSVRVYINDVNVNNTAHLNFLASLVRNEKVSVIKADTEGQTIIKSVLINEETFPFTSLQWNDQVVPLLNQGKTISNQTSPRLLPYFSKQTPLFVMPLNQSIEEGKLPLEGTYTFISTQPFDQNLLLRKLADFYGLTSEALTTQHTICRSEIINLQLMVLVISLVLVLILTMVIRFVIPFTQLKDVGVKRLLGFKKWDLFLLENRAEFMVVILFLIGIDSYFWLSRNFFPSGFWPSLLLVQYILFIFILFQTYFILIFKQKLSISDMIKKHFPQMRLLTYFVTFIKVITVAALFYLSFQLALLNKENQNTIAKAQSWEPYLDLMVTDQFFFTSKGENAMVLGNNPQMTTMNKLFKQSEPEGTYYILNQPFKQALPLNQDKLSQGYNFLSVNENYFKDMLLNQGIQTDLPAMSENLLLVPKKWLSKANLTTELQWLVYQQLDETKRPQDFQQIALNVIPYEVDNAFFTFDDTNPYVTNPIIHVMNRDTMYFSEQFMLGTTSLKGPFKFKNDTNTLARMKQLAQSNSDLVEVRFKSIRNYFKDILDFNNGFMQVQLGIVSLTHLINIFVSLMILVSLMLLRWQKLFVQQLLGFRKFDKYRKEIIGIMTLYVLFNMGLFGLTQSPMALVLGLSFFLVELLVDTVFLRLYEQQSLLRMIKGGVL